jgi:ribonucleoside-diphosphate reductase alpha chain
MDPENGQTRENAVSWVAHFPVKSPDIKNGIFRNDRSAIEQLNYWKQVKINYTEGNPSVTITYREDEVFDIIKWVNDKQEWIAGISFLPNSDAKYDQMPYEEIDRETYEKLNSEFPTINWSKIYRYELEDMTNAAQELACTSGQCMV